MSKNSERKRFSRVFGSFSLVLSATVGLSACSYLSPTSAPPQPIRWLADGQIVISRPAPTIVASESIPADTDKEGVEGRAMFGFTPGRTAINPDAAPSGPWLVIDRQHGVAELHNGEQLIHSTTIHAPKSMTAGHYKVALRQKEPLWYAPDSYFLNRKLAVPPAGASLRFRRGALGEYALFLDSHVPVHCGPVWSDEVGGIQMNEQDMEAIFHALEIGSVIEVK